MKMERLKRLNPAYSFYTVDDESFKQYGRKLKIPSGHLMVYVYQNIPLVGQSFRYEPDYPALHHFAIFSRIKRDIFRGKDIRFGIVSGFNEYADPMIENEKTKCLIAFTDCILALRTNGNHPLCFVLKKGDCVELYPGTFHSLPIHAHLKGFAVGILYEKRQRIRCVNR